MSYGPNIPDLFRRSADLVDRILRGAKPGDIPVEQPTRLELFINLKVARTLRLAVPPTLLTMADEVLSDRKMARTAANAALRDNPFKAHAGGVLEHDRAGRALRVLGKASGTRRKASSDGAKPIRPVPSVPRPQANVRALLARDQPIAVILHLMDPIGACRDLGGQRGLARSDEAGRREPLPGERGAHQHR